MRKQKENAHHIKNPTNNSNNQFVKKQGRPLKEVVPGNYTKYLRENIPITIPVYKNGDERNYNPCAEPFEIPPEWNEEDAQAFNADVNNPPQNQSEETEFSDPMHPEIEKHLPLSLLQYCNFNVKWIRPKDYVKNFYLDKEIKISYPKKNYVKMRIDIKDTYEIFKKAIASGVDNYEYDIDMLLADDEESRKKNIYKYFYRILDRELEIKVVEIKERPETDEEYKKRRDLEIEEKMKQEALIKSSKKMKTNESKKAATPLSRAHANEKSLITKTISAGFTGYHEERLNLILANPTNITVSEAYKDPTKSIIILSTPAKMMNYNFAKWVGSVFQTIIDQNILDAYTDRPIWHNIYPQKDNFPIFSPTGRYMIKLYFMGKPRKIEIDDSIPCNGDDEYILPFCGSIEEIWPALFTKALIKLNRYKTKYPEHVIDEIGDSSIIYNLTGYIGQTVNLEQHSEEDVKFLKSMQDMLSDEIYCEKKKILICYKKHTQLSENQVTNFEKKAEIEESESPLRDVIKNLFSLKKKTTVKSDSTLVKEKLEMSSIRRFDRSSTRKLSYTGGFLKNLINIGVQGLNFKRPSAQSMFNTEKNRKSSVKEGDENIRTSVQPGEPASLTTGNSNLYYDFAYSISDFFDNENFNVKRLNQVDFSDLKKKLKEFQTSCVYKQLNKDDKKKYIYTLIELKNGEKEEKLIRMEELKKEVRKFNLVKIMNESYGNNSLNFYIPYTPEEILMVKTCLLNNWEFPPPSYFDEKYKISNRNHNIPGLSSKTLSSKKDIDSIKNSHKDIKGYRVIKETESGMESLLGLSQEYSLAVNEQKFPKHTVSHSSWNKESYMQLIENNLDQYAYPKEPIVRQNGGVWIHYPEFKTYFNRFIILHNPNKLYTSHISCENFWKNWKQDMFDPNEVNSVFILNQKEKSLFSENKSSSNMLMLFKPNSEKSFLHSEKIKSYIQFKIVDSDNNVVHDKVILKSFFSTFYTDVLTPDKNYFIIIDGGIIPFGYFIQIFSESHSVTSISHSNYLKTYFGFQSINLRIDHPSIEKSKYYILSRFSIKCLNYTSELLNVEFSINYPDKYAKRFFDIICYKNTTTNKHVLNFNEVIKLKQDANIYYFVLCVKPGYILAENTLEFECLYDKKEVKVEHYDHVEGYEVYDKFTSNKQGILFKEFIYYPDIVHASFAVKIQEAKIITQQEQILPLVNTSRLGSSKEKEKSTLQQAHDTGPALFPILDKIRLRLVLYKVKSLSTITPNFDLPKEFICQWEFFNETLVHHVTLEGLPWIEKPIEAKKGQKNENSLNIRNAPRHDSVHPSITHPLPYLLVCYIDQTEAPDYIKDITGNILKTRNIDIFWTIRVFSTDTLGFVKDTTKEDSEKVLKVSWETNEHGRCEKSRKSRIRFLLQLKSEKGAQLTPEEEFILNEVRERKITTAPQLEEHKTPVINNLNNPGNKKGNTANKKSDNLKATDKKGNNSNQAAIISTVVALKEPRKLDLIYNKELPLPEKHVSDYIKNFLFYSYDERTHIFDNNLNQLQKLIVDNKTKEEKTNQIIKHNEEFEKSRTSRMNPNVYNKSENSESIKSFYKTSFSFRKEIRDDTTVLIRARDHLKNEFQNKFELEKNIKEIILNPTNNFDYVNAITLMKEYPTFTNYNQELVTNLRLIISMKKEEILKAELKKLTGKDKNAITKHLEDIKIYDLKVSAEVIQKLRDLIK